MSDDLKAKLREILLDMLVDGQDASIDHEDGWTYLWRVRGEHLDDLCQLVGLDDVADAQESIAAEIMAGKRDRR